MNKKILFAMMVVLAFSMGQECSPDEDHDGVPDSLDLCSYTPICAEVNADGCPSDDDGDGVFNGCDECPGTVAGAEVYGNGCPITDDGGGVRARCVVADPRAKGLEYSLVNRTSATSGEIMIKGTVENFGLSDYLSAAGQQSIELWEDRTMVAAQSFQNLAVDETIYVEYRRNWDTIAEFHPSVYELIISYDPDIYDDGNPNNDDCNSVNNTIVRTVADISSLFD